MAKLEKINKEAWDAWVVTRPKVIQDMCARLPPDRLYRMKSTGHRVFLYSYSENNTVTVCVTGEFNACTFERMVFGVEPNDLEECDLPGPDEKLGALLKDPEDIKRFIATMKKEEQS